MRIKESIVPEVQPTNFVNHFYIEHIYIYLGKNLGFVQTLVSQKNQIRQVKQLNRALFVDETKILSIFFTFIFSNIKMGRPKTRMHIVDLDEY